MDYEYVFDRLGRAGGHRSERGAAHGTEAQEARRQLTGRQRNVMAIARILADDMDTNGTVAEQHTAALLTIARDAIEHGYEAELVALARAWRREVEQGQP